MSGSFYYGLKARFYGLFIQLPWSLFVTICVLMPVAYEADQQARSLLMELVIYWALFAALIWLIKDIYAQRFLLEFSIHDNHLCVYKNNTLITMYALNQIKVVKDISRDNMISRVASGGGVIVTFDDGCEIPVFNLITNYQKLNNILSSSAMMA